MAHEIERAYADRTPRSAALAADAARVLPSGIVHDSRHLKPHPIYATRAEGAHKWDGDGNRYIDYYGGHGALLLGHNHPEVIAAARAQLALGTHFAACHEAEIRWAGAICQMVPSAERVRFHSSGTEATTMAVRLARAHTGRPKLMRFFGHYHGWMDDMTTGYASHFNGSAPIGVPQAVAGQSVPVDPYEEAAVERHLAPGNDIAAVIVEPLGAATGKVPLDRDFLRRLREWTAASGTVLIFDEVVTGFRVAPGGMQELTGITPDLTTMAKIVAGGLPGGAVAGRADILSGLDFEATGRSGREKIYHPGTFNACPVSAAAGIEALRIIREGDACARASALAADLRSRLAGVLADLAVPWTVYGEASAIQLWLGGGPDEFAPRAIGFTGLKTQDAETVRLLRLALNVHGVDFAGSPGGLVSAAHSEADLAATADAFRAAVGWMQRTDTL